MCLVPQSQEDGELGGHLGDRNYDVVRHRRTRQQVISSRKRMREKGIGSAAAAALSRELGVLQPEGNEQESALYDMVSMHQPMDSCCPELLHLNHLVRGQG